MDNSSSLRLRATLSASAVCHPGGEFEVLAITAGAGNGWEFGEAALRESMALWDGAECFVDHALHGHSLRDLAGVLHSPRWDSASRGIQCRLRAVGPSAALLAEIGQQMLSGQQPGPRVGFSADVLFTAQGRRVEKILRVLSVDLVYHPARGGAFLRSVDNNPVSIQENGMEELTLASSLVPPPDDQVERKQLSHEAALIKETCALMLEAELLKARLPKAAEDLLRNQFAGKDFDRADLSRAIADARGLVSALSGGQAVQGVRGGASARIEGMVSSADQFSAAVHDLLGADRPEDLRGVHPHRLSGIRELYMLMTGDTGFRGGYDPEHAMFATTADLPGVLKNALNKLIVQEWDELGRSGYGWWEPIVAVEHFNNLQPVTGVLVGEVTLLPSVAEGAAYTELGVADSAETGAWGKYGGYIGLTMEMFERDETHKLRQYPRKLASASLRRISALVGSVFTAANGVGPNMADGNPVFGAARANLGTDALASAAWEAASKAIYEQPMLVDAGDTAPILAQDARYLIVPRALRLAARQILYPAFEREATIFTDNLQRGSAGDVITCPEFSDAKDWAAVADPRLAPGIILAERFGVRPEIIIADAQTNGALFTNDELRMKVRHWVSVFVADYRPLFKANVP